MSTLNDLIKAGFPKRQASVLAAQLASAGGGGGEAPSGGGGGPLGYAQVRPGTITQSATTGGKRASTTGWTLTNFKTGTGMIVPGTNGFGFAEAGWYQVTLNVWAGFTGTAPTFLRCTCDFYDGYGIAHEFPVMAAAGLTGATSSSRSAAGVIGHITSLPFYQDGDEVTGTDNNSVNLQCGWDSDAVLTTATGGAAAPNALNLFVARLA